MSEQPAETRVCPTCGNTIPAMARYCPSCGTRLNPAEAYTADDFEDALADVLEAPVDEQPVAPNSPTVSPDEPTATPPEAVEATAGRQEEWTARASDWVQPSAGAGAWTAPSPPVTVSKSRGNRTLWIVLAILGFLVFCCCGLMFTALLIDGTTSAAQNDVSIVGRLIVI